MLEAENSNRSMNLNMYFSLLGFQLSTSDCTSIIGFSAVALAIAVVVTFVATAVVVALLVSALACLYGHYKRKNKQSINGGVNNNLYDLKASFHNKK